MTASRTPEPASAVQTRLVTSAASANGFALSAIRRDVAHTNSAATATRKRPTHSNPSVALTIQTTVQAADPASTPQPRIHQPLWRITPMVPMAMASR